MYRDEVLKLVEQPRRIAVASTAAGVRRMTKDFITAAETAALLEVTKNVLRRWRARGYGLKARPEGRLYAADRVQQLAPMPRRRCMLAISRQRG